MPLLTQYASRQTTTTGTQSLWDVGLEAFLQGLAPEEEEFEEEEFEEFEEEDEFVEEDFEEEEEPQAPVLARAPNGFARAIVTLAPTLIGKFAAPLVATAAAAPVITASAGGIPAVTPAVAGGVGGGGLLGVLAPLAFIGATAFGAGFSLTRGTGTLFGGGRRDTSLPDPQLPTPEVQVGGNR